MRHGLFSQPRAVIEIVLPELNAFYLQWTQPTKEPQAEVDTIVKKYFCSESETLNKRRLPPLRQLSSFTKRWPLIGLQLVLQAYKVKQVKRIMLVF